MAEGQDGAEQQLYADLVERARALPYYATAWPPKRDRRQQPVGLLPNRIETMPEKAAAIGRHAAGAAPLADARLVPLLRGWLELKATAGSEVERGLYAGMDVASLVQRLLVERPLVFFKSHDEFALRSGETGAGGAALDLDTEGLDEVERLGGFAKVGTDAEEEPLTLAKTLSYDEMALAALLSVANPTLFINDGDRGNQAKPQRPGSFEPEGVLTGSVGARFEACEHMEWRHIVVTHEQNTAAKGYGAEADPEAAQTKLLGLWARFYQLERFPSYEEVRAEVAAAAAAGTESRYFELRIVRHGDVSKPKYFDSRVYKQRLAVVLAPWLLDCNRRAQEAGTTAFCATTGLGLGAWGVDSRQGPLMREVYTELLSSLPLPAVSDFVCGDPADLGVMEGEWLSNASTGNAIRIRPSKVRGQWRNPATKLVGADEGKLLCAMYAWDGGAYPGNEFYEPYGMLSGSGDPAAACCSTITELGNPEINPAVCGANTLMCGADGSVTPLGAAVGQAPPPAVSAAAGQPPTLRRSVSAEGLDRLLGRKGLSPAQRTALLARLGQRERPAEALDGLLQQSDAGLELGRLMAERAALRALAEPSGAAEAAQFSAELEALPDGASVAVMTLLGSLNPVTLGHVRCFEEARQILLGADGAKRPAQLEEFDCCIGLIEMNSDQRVGKKMAEAGDVLIPQTQRSRLVQLAAAGHAWLGLGWPLAVDKLQAQYPNLKLTSFRINGADDVVKYGKFWSKPSARIIVMGRPGSTEAVLEGMATARNGRGQPAPISEDDANFVLGPELPDISSSAARAATSAGDEAALRDLVHPLVSEWLLEQEWAGVDGSPSSEPEPAPEGVPPPAIEAERLVSAGIVTEDDVSQLSAEVEELVKSLLLTTPIVKKPKGPPRPPGPPAPAAASERQVLFLRHGEGEHNATRNMKLVDPPLTEQGRAQAAKLAGSAELADCQLLVVSPLSRAIQTAVEALPWASTWSATQGQARRVVLSPLHSERYSAPCDAGRSKQELAAALPCVRDWQGFAELAEDWSPTWQNDMKWAEERVPRFKQWLAEQPEQRIVVVGHGGFFSACLPGNKRLRNCEIAEFGRRPAPGPGPGPGPPPPPPGPPPNLADLEDKRGGAKAAAELDPSAKLKLEIEQAPLRKKKKAGAIAPEEEARLAEIEALLHPSPAPAPAPDARGGLMAAINARRVG